MAISLNLDIITKTTADRYPPWCLSNNSCDISLSKYIKTNTANNIFKRLYLEKEHTYRMKGWTLIFTDGSKTSNSITSYAVVDFEGHILSLKVLPHMSSIFTAEASAIIEAMEIALHRQIRAVICSDSLSVINSVRNPTAIKWIKVNRIRDLLIQFPNTLKILGVPGHINIKGNEYADYAAKFACKAPIVMVNEPEKTDFRNLIKEHIVERQALAWSSYYHPHYKEINKNNNHPQYPTNVTRHQIHVFSRLRLGHTFATHNHLLNRQPAPSCSKCNLPLTINHLLVECPHYRHLRRSIFGTDSPNNLLETPTRDNIRKIYDYINHIGIKV